MKVYCVSGDGEPPAYWGTVREALKDARDRSKASDTEVTVEHCTLVPFTKDVILRVLNQGGGYVESSVTVLTFKDGREVK